MQQGQKRVMQISPERETKRKKTMETRKAEEAMMRKCGEILEKLMNSKHGWVFNEPVDVVAFGLKDYYEVVKHPMDLGTVKSKLEILNVHRSMNNYPGRSSELFMQQDLSE
ncbi:hypothetical protein POM88_047662 [Heracleum sosnowskyi]|uniref:Bromo domain-containing protein n=1 Tax=Heracleum sosnowskyi TaxID=360622 RepID=A0AAD8LYY4_9APIA|nr:hypothetical protein POM88_047662 [Heracleum sosnowskyi]